MEKEEEKRNKTYFTQERVFNSFKCRVFAFIQFKIIAKPFGN